MVAMLARNWWAFALQGVLAIVWGILAILWPGLTLRVLVTLFGAYALVDGILSVIAGKSQPTTATSAGGRWCAGWSGSSSAW